MEDVPAKNTPMLAGWVMAAGFGAVAMGAGYVAIGLGAMGAAFVGAIVFTVTGLVLGLPSGNLAKPGDAAAPKETATVHPVIHVAAPAVAATVAAPVVAAPAAATPTRPAGLATARDGRADDLKIIKGIGPKLEELCHSLGYYHFDQVAAWTEAEIAWVDDNLEGFKGRVSRDRWVPQAKAILAHGQDEFLRRLDAGETF